MESLIRPSRPQPPATTGTYDQMQQQQLNQSAESHNAEFLPQLDEAFTFFEDNNDIISDAFGALSALTTSELANQSPGVLLAAAEKIVGALDCIQQIHPAIAIAVGTFHALLKLEMKRRENDQRVAALIVQASSAMAELLQLRNLQDSEVLALDGSNIAGPLQSCLTRLVNLIKDCGNTADKYYKSRTIARYLKAGQWEEKFVAFAQDFAAIKQDVQTAVLAHSALHIEHTVAQLAHVQLRLDNILDLLRTKTAAEQYFANEIRRCGGLAACLHDDATIRAVIREFSGDRRSTSTREFRALLAESRMSLESQLADNRPLFELELESVTNSLTLAITTRVEEIALGSEDRIIRALRDRGEGPHQKIKDPHIRYVWRQMGFALSVKTTYFIPALCEHIFDQYRNHPGRFPRRLLATKPFERSSSPAFSALSGSLTDSSFDDDHPPPVSLSDEWCLLYLNVFSFPSLKDAFDEDANGLVSARDINSFSRSTGVMRDWTLPQQLAYASAGFSIEMQRYRDMILALLREIMNFGLEVLPENRGLVCAYLDTDAILLVRKICFGIKDVIIPGGIQLVNLVEQRIAAHQSRYTSRLERCAYEIPSAQFVDHVLNNGRVEEYLLPLTYTLLLRHAEVVKLSKRIVLDSRELETAASSLQNVLRALQDRIERLGESFKQRGDEPVKRFETFANGLYSLVVDSNAKMDEVAYWESHTQDAVDMGILLQNLRPEQLRYPPPDPLWDIYGRPHFAESPLSIPGPGSQLLGSSDSEFSDATWWPDASPNHGS
ncbi:hypothetical protein EXIGLDRAFT_763961 [Exidia glandulosa HHB12029]|uniref:EF-hand domain-containing protein n=1 Tax=Exidia glandulosa HHB12029 TaxID=1314781 RepID=A0A165LJ34_EXIGL|nr:hypothetical protein EXIGLDRAFT_763961 [Exidia glandulosa HHB12029]